MGGNLTMTLGKPIKRGFLLKQGREGKFLHGTIKQYGNKKGVVKKIPRIK